MFASGSPVVSMVSLRYRPTRILKITVYVTQSCREGAHQQGAVPNVDESVIQRLIHRSRKGGAMRLYHSLVLHQGNAKSVFASTATSWSITATSGAILNLDPADVLTIAGRPTGDLLAICSNITIAAR